MIQGQLRRYLGLSVLGGIVYEKFKSENMVQSDLVKIWPEFKFKAFNGYFTSNSDCSRKSPDLACSNKTFPE